MPNHLSQLSKEELIEKVLRQQQTINRLQITLHYLENVVQKSPKASPDFSSYKCPLGFLFAKKYKLLQFIWGRDRAEQVSIKDLFPPACVEMALHNNLDEELKTLSQDFLVQQQKKIEKLTRQALRHLYDIPYLERSPLLLLIAKTRHIQLSGSDLQENLFQAIEAAKPTKDQPNAARWQVRYDILRLSYKEKQKPDEVAETLSLSNRQYFRELKKAIRNVAIHLFNISQ